MNRMILHSTRAFLHTQKSKEMQQLLKPPSEACMSEKDAEHIPQRHAAFSPHLLSVLSDFLLTSYEEMKNKQKQEQARSAPFATGSYWMPPPTLAVGSPQEPCLPSHAASGSRKTGCVRDEKVEIYFPSRRKC